jgi:hypothetical protein
MVTVSRCVLLAGIAVRGNTCMLSRSVDTGQGGAHQPGTQYSCCALLPAGLLPAPCYLRLCYLRPCYLRVCNRRHPAGGRWQWCARSPLLVALRLVKTAAMTPAELRSRIGRSGVSSKTLGARAGRGASASVRLAHEYAPHQDVREQ